MEVRCERCRAQYVFSDDQVGEHGLTVRCSNCGHLFKVKKKALVVTLPVGPEESGSGAVSAADAQRAAAVQAAAQAVFNEGERRDWSLRQPSGQIYTFKDMSTLHRWIVERKAHREDEISRANEPWRRLGSIPELQSFFAVVEAAERAAHAVPPPAQATMLQFPAQGTPVRAQATAAATAKGKTEFFAPPAPPAAAPGRPTPIPGPAPGRTEFFAPPPPPAPARPTPIPAPAPGRTEFFAPPPPPPAAAPTRATVPPPVTRTEVFVPPPPPPPPPPAPSRLEGIFTPDPVPAATSDPFATPFPGPGETANLDTEQGIPPPPPPSAAPIRPTTAPWESSSQAPAKARSREPAWTRADAQTGGTLENTLEEAPRKPAPKRGALVNRLAAVLAIGVAAAAAWWLFLRPSAPPPKPQVAAAPVLPAPAPPPPAPAPAPAEPPKVEAKPAEPPQAATQPAEQAPVAKAEPAPEKAPEKATERTPEKAPPPAPVAEKKPAPPPEPAPKVAADEPKEAAPQEPKAAAPKEPAAPSGPKALKALLGQAKKLRDRGRSSQALEVYAKAVALAPQSAEAQAGRGWCYLELSQYAPAEASFQAALEADPEGPDALLGLAETFRYEGRRADAVQYYERYLAAHPDGEDAVAARNAIKSLKE